MAIQGKGTTMKFTPDGGTAVSIGKLTKVGEIAPEAEEVDVTTLDSTGGYREYMQGWRDAGTIAVNGFFDSGNAGQTALRTAFDNGKAGAFEVSFADGSKAAFSAFVKKYAIGAAEVDGAVGFLAQLRVSGAVTFTAGA